MARHQAIIFTNTGMLLIGHQVTNFNEILIKIYAVSLKEMHLKMSYAKMAAILSSWRWVETCKGDAPMFPVCAIYSETCL